ncbi:hypothetical protein [Actinophytocola gossypii]|uniref:Acyl-CoA dehydrogenase n=1 Tax=Actinophytocola gossypii TaxID=2812003 RepID=A0ABT2JGP5_9PSEU|nr:hypothetical protein [Actinophytocola gossypii]MCT2587046.1 hypothetical protein [Actinophytocola gossypii]
MSSPSATMAVWSSAWLSGAAAADDVLDALQGWAELHDVVAADERLAATLELPERGQPGAGPATLLASLRLAGVGGARLVMPVAGDVRGLGGPSEFATEALRAGEAIVFETDAGGLGLVPERVGRDDSGIVRWTVFPTPRLAPVPNVPLGEAEHELTGAMRVAAGMLIELGVAKRRAGVREELQARVADRTRSSWPDGMPQRALRVLQRAAEVSGILELAMEDEPGGALSASAAHKRAEALRPLFQAVRTARCAAVADAVRALSDHARAD